jgi:hypothetical protein
MRRIVVLLAVVAMMVGMLGTSVAPAFAVSQGVAFKQNCTSPSVYSDHGTKKWRDDTCSALIGTNETTNLAGFVGTWETWKTMHADGSPETNESYIVACESPSGGPAGSLSDCYGPFV